MKDEMGRTYSTHDEKRNAYTIFCGKGARSGWVPYPVYKLWRIGIPDRN
jgi:hypothetical protein